jgi:signal transduction histidine kinase/DNA-binding response OmpR family regulator
MSEISETSIHTRSNELREIQEKLQRETFTLALVGVFIAGLILLGGVPYLASAVFPFVVAFGLFFLATLAWTVCRWSYTLAAWLLVTGCQIAILVLVVSNQIPLALFFIFLPVGLATLAISRLAGAAVAVVNTLVLFIPASPLVGLDTTLRVLALLEMWATLGLIWLTLYPLIQIVSWTWSGYRDSLDLLRESREHQQKLGQVMEDLKSANLQLTRLNRLAQNLRQIAEDERQAKAQFAANVSHELRTPLNMIVGFCEMITNNPESYGAKVPPALLADLEVVLRNSQHLSSLINDVLDLSQVDAGQAALVVERSSLAEIAQSAVIAVRPLYESKGLSLEIECPPDLPELQCDPTRIREVILNLLSNAGRFTEQGGALVKIVQQDNRMIVSISDTGPGISDDNLKRLFQPFSQLDGSIRRRYGGTGLGLSISKKFVELHDGRMTVESKLGHGTTFTFSLPVEPVSVLDKGALRWLNPYQPYDSSSHDHRPPEVNVLSRVLVVEESNQVQRLLHRYWEKVDIVPFVDLDSAVKELNKSPALALMVNTLRTEETLQQLKGSAELPYGVPVMISSLQGIHEEFVEMGVVGYLVKPISREAMLDAIDQLGQKVKTILVVDDEPDALQLFRRILSSAGRGYRVLRAADGKQALEVLQNHRPDVILMDLVMPEMDGFQVLAALHADPQLQRIPVILISAQDPAGHPIASNALTVTCRDGLSAHSLLMSMQALTAALAKTGQSHEAVLTTGSPG